MARVELSRTSLFSARQMFDLVADVAAYDQFVPLCRKSVVFDVEDEDGDLKRFKASLLVERASLRLSEEFTSDVVANAHALTVVSRANSGPVRHLKNAWRFIERPEGGCHIKLLLEFEVKSAALSLLVKTSLDMATRKVADAFEQRAQSIYGRSGDQVMPFHRLS